MTFRGTLRRCFVWLLCLSLCLGLAVPVLAEDNTGTEIRLLQTEGTVNVSSTSGKTYSTREDMRLYSGYVVSTEEASYAWITLDAEKAVKLDECSSLEVRRSGKSLELLLKSGEMYCDVTAPLKEDEKLNIRTSTMVTGVRGTIVYIQKISDDETHLGVLEGRAQGVAINPITGATRALMVRQGQIGVFKVYDADEAGEGADAWLLGMKVDDIPPFVQVQIAQDPAARVRVPKDLQKSLTEALQDLLKKQAETRQKLEEIEELKEEEVISKDPLWEGKQGGDTGSYTITWNIDGRTETTTCKAGAMPGHSAPEKAGYVFAGWSPELAPAEADAAYTAIYIPIDSIIVEPEPQPEPEPEPQNQYTITWLDADQTLLDTTVVTEGEPLAGRAPNIVEREGAEFVGWSDGTETYAPDELPAAAGNVTYTAVFEELQTIYKITWQDEEGNVLETSEVSPGERPNYPGEEQPIKEGFRFVGWEPTVAEAWEDAVYTTVFEEIDPEAETGIITWVINGEEETEEYEIGATPSHDIPTLESLVFTGWYDGSRVYGPEEELPAVTGNTTYTAEFSEASYTVTWVIDGESEEETYIVGDTPVHEIPEKIDPAGEITYSFAGWSDGTETYAEDLPMVTKDVTYTAVYEQLYTITWLNWDGNTLLEDLVASGETPEYAGNEPTRTATQQYTYSFSGWDPEVVPVTGAATYTAQFEAALQEYTITWVDGDGNTVFEDTVAYGETPEYGGDEPTKEDDDYRYTFNGTWDPEIAAVTGEETYTAQFNSVPLYAIELDQPEKNGNPTGTLEADVQKAAEDEPVTVTLTPEPGYDIVEAYITYTVDGTEENRRLQGENGTYTFEMPAAMVTVGAMLEGQPFRARAVSPTNEPDGYDTIVMLLENGEPTTSIEQVPTGDTVTVQVSWANQASMLDSVTMTWDGGSETQEMTSYEETDDRSVSTFTFTMPAGDAEFTATLSPVYEITLYETMFNSAKVSVNSSDPEAYEMYFRSKAGEEVSVVITPTDGSAIAAGSKPSVTYTVDNTPVAVPVSGDNGNYTFKMPEYPVSVNMPSVRVETVSGEADTLTISANGTVVSVSNGEALLVSGGTEVTVNAVTNDYFIWGCESSYDNLEITHVDNDRKNETYSFIMPDDADEIWLYIEIHGE